MSHLPTPYHRIIAVVWLSVVAGLYGLFWLTEITTLGLLVSVFHFFTNSWWGAGLFLLFYIARPLTLLPMSIFSVLSGVFFGLWLGAIVVYIGVIVSATISFLLGRWLRQAIFALPTPPVNQTLLRRRPFEVVTGLHLTMLPFDLINYGAGLLQVPWRPFLGGVLVGIIPGVISLTALGAAVNVPMLLSGDVTWQIFDWRYVALSATVFVLTLASSQAWRRHKATAASITRKAD